MRLTLSARILALAALAAGPLHAGEAVALDQVGVRLTLPDGFVVAPEVVGPRVVAAYTRPVGAGREVPAMIVVSRMGGTIGRDTEIPPEIRAKNPSVTTSTEKWKGFDILVCRVPEQAEGVSALTLNAQVPIRQGAVQIGVLGEADQEAELRDLLRAVLANLDGETNWLTTERRVEKTVTGVIRLAITAAVFVAVVVGVVRSRRERKPAPTPPPDSA